MFAVCRNHWAVTTIIYIQLWIVLVSLLIFRLLCKRSFSFVFTTTFSVWLAKSICLAFPTASMPLWTQDCLSLIFYKNKSIAGSCSMIHFPSRFICLKLTLLTLSPIIFWMSWLLGRHTLNAPELINKAEGWWEMNRKLTQTAIKQVRIHRSALRRPCAICSPSFLLSRWFIKQDWL